MVERPQAHGRALPKVSLLVAMRNEAEHIEGCLQSILEQDYPAELLETLVFDGRSTDASLEIAHRMVANRAGWSVEDNPEIIQAAAWNLGITRATGDVVGIVSAHTELATDYVSQAVATLQRTGADLVGGPVRAYGSTYIGQAISIATSSPFGVGDARGHYTEREEEVDTVFQGVCRKEMYARIGGFDPEMVRNQDDELSYRLRRSGGRIVCNPAIRTRYHNRATLRSLARQYAHYGFWKVRVMQKLPRQMQPRQFVPAAFVAALCGSVAAAAVTPWGLVALAVVAGSYATANIAASALAARTEGGRFFPVLPIVFVTLHVSYGAGFLVGLPRWYLRHQPRGRPEARTTTEQPSERA